MLFLPLLSSTPDIDPGAMAVLVEADRKVRQIRTLSATCTHTLFVSHPGRTGFMRQVMKIALRRPNLARVDTSLEGVDKNGSRTHIEHYSVVLAAANSLIRVYPNGRTSDTDPHTAPEAALKMVTPLAGFFDQKLGWPSSVEAMKNLEVLRSVRLLGSEMRSGAQCKIVRIAYRDSGSRDDEILTLSIDSNGLPRRLSVDWSSGRAHGADDLTDVRIDKPIDPRLFTYRAPANFHPSAPKGQDSASLPVGAQAPDFTVSALNGRPIRLSDFRGKVVVLDFWATWCANCTAGFPHLAELAGKDVVVFAIDVQDTANVYKKWVAQHPQFSSFVFARDPKGMDGDGVSKLFKGIGLPTTYVVDRCGRIVASLAGREIDTDERISKVVRETVAAGTAP